MSEKYLWKSRIFRNAIGCNDFQKFFPHLKNGEFFKITFEDIFRSFLYDAIKGWVKAQIY